MTAKQYLRQIATIAHRLDRIRQQLSILSDEMKSLKSPDYGKDRVVSAASGDQMVSMIIRYDEQYSKLMREQRTLLETRAKICEEIEQLEDDRYKQVLFERYIALKPWEKVAETTGYDSTYIYDLHGKALAAFARQHKKKLGLKTS